MMLWFRLVSFILFYNLLSGSMAQNNLALTKSDFVSSFDTFYMSSASILSGFSPGDSGTEQVWDFSDLEINNSRTDTFFSMNVAPGSFRFIMLGSSHFQKGGQLQGQSGMPGNQNASNFYSFFRNNNSAYDQIGIGFSMDGTPVPARYTEPDRIFSYPLVYGNEDSSNSSFTIPIPNIYYEQSHKRINKVDAEGILYLPNDTFEVLRMRSVNEYSDSFNVAGVGGRSPIPTVIEYYWLAKDEGIPVLFASGSSIAGQFVATEVEFKDERPEVEIDTTSIDELPENVAITIFPNPVNEILNFEHKLHFGNQYLIEIYSTEGKLQMSRNKLIEHTSLSLNVSTLSKGQYILVLRNKDSFWSTKFQKN